MSLTFWRVHNRKLFAKVSVRATIYTDLEMLAKLWLADNVDREPPPSKHALEKAIERDVREYGANHENRVGIWWSDSVENPEYYDQEHVKNQLAATIDAIKRLYGLKEN